MEPWITSTPLSSPVSETVGLSNLHPISHPPLCPNPRRLDCPCCRCSIYRDIAKRGASLDHAPPFLCCYTNCSFRLPTKTICVACGSQVSRRPCGLSASCRSPVLGSTGIPYRTMLCVQPRPLYEHCRLRTVIAEPSALMPVGALFSTFHHVLPPISLLVKTDPPQ